VSEQDVARARMQFLNYPSNPCGALASREVLADAVRWARDTSTPIVHDLAYGELTFTGEVQPSILSVDGARDVCVELVSTSKTWCLAGWRIGFLCGNREIVARVRTLLDHMSVGSPMPLQRGVVAALTGPQDSVAELRATYARRAKRVADALGATPSEGSYYVWWKLPAHLTTAALLADNGVALAPGEGFGARGHGWARISVATTDEQLELGLERLLAVL
jgi:aspartate/methionine/tyrosine aminotransferase